MVRAVKTAQAAPGGYPTVLPTLTFAALDNVNGDEFVASGNDLIIFLNTTGSPVNVTLGSSPDALGRSGDVVKSVPANGYALAGPIPAAGWRQSNGRVFINAAAAGLSVAIVRLP